MWRQLLQQIKDGDTKALARCISFVENEQDGYADLLQSLSFPVSTKIIGITGPPGAGKSTLVDALISRITSDDKKVAVLCVDPSSPFNLGALLGDRIRMSSWYTHPQVFIRSLATRGSMGGLNPKIIEIADVLKAASFDYIIVETVGVGQSEIEIAGLADTTVVVLVPEAGDEVQTMKAGLMEIADIFVVNKSDRPDADAFVKNLRLMLAPAFHKDKPEIPIVKTIGNTGEGVNELFSAIRHHQQENIQNERKSWLLAEQAYQLLQKHRMKNVNKVQLQQQIQNLLQQGEPFNLYEFVDRHSSSL
ncbi:MAG: methylmalonyl Co-A mutase-associated GTPase MeaB [Candidatus Dadabacteria bacterium]